MSKAPLDIKFTDDLPPLLAKEMELTTRMSWESNLSIMISGTATLLSGRKNFRVQKFINRYGRLGQVNIAIAGGLLGFFAWHRIRYPTLTEQFPEGYYRKILTGEMPRDVATKSKYFSSHPDELRKREEAIGIYKLDGIVTEPKSSGSRTYTTYEELRAKHEAELKAAKYQKEYEFGDKDEK